MAKLTEAQRKALEWFAKNEPVGLFPYEGPSRQTRLNLERLGLIEIVDRRPFRLIKFARTETGRSALAEPAARKAETPKGENDDA